MEEKKRRDKPPAGNTFEAFCKRLDWIKKRTGVEFDQEEKRWGSESRGVIENPIGFVKMPLSIAGPILIDGTYAKGEFIVPLCTVEATLSMSLNRGAYLTSLAGGIKTLHLKQSISRSPVFFLPDLKEAHRFIEWVKSNYSEIERVANGTTQHGKLEAIDTYFIGSNVILDFNYTTAEASGQNMTTFATSEVCRWITKQFAPLEYLIESNFSGDKNSSFKSLFKQRGHSVICETVIEKKLLEKVLGEGAAEKLVKSSFIGATGSSLAGIPTFNLHTVNALCAIYMACGQDVACVVENSMNTLYSEVTPDGNLKSSLNMPSITVGTVGKGTQLEDQEKNLKILGCTGKDSSKKFAEIIAASCLCIEVSLGVAIAYHEFVKAHLKYSRGIV